MVFRFLASVIAFGICSSLLAQEKIMWSDSVKLKLNDFKSPQTEINPNLKYYTIYSGSSLDFGYQMISYQFMVTKNFNSTIKCYFTPSVASVAAPDTVMAEKLVSFEQYTFDLAELYARKFRKEAYDSKSMFSDFNFVQPIFERLRVEMDAEKTRVWKATIANDQMELLETENQLVREQIALFPDFCLECKIPKKKKS